MNNGAQLALGEFMPKYPDDLQSGAEVKDFLDAVSVKVDIPVKAALSIADEFVVVNVCHFESLTRFYIILEKEVDSYFRFVGISLRIN